MFKALKRPGGQFLGEYSLTLAIVILAILGMSVFMKRLFNARINSARAYMMETLDQDIRDVHWALGAKPYPDTLYEYEPYYYNSQGATDSFSSVETNMNAVSYVRNEETVTAMNVVAQELPARVDVFNL